MKNLSNIWIQTKKKVEPDAPAVRIDRRSVKGKYRRRIYCDTSLLSIPLYSVDGEAEPPSKNLSKSNNCPVSP
jgi:hypothetical protein